MYQLGTKWKLWQLQEVFKGESSSITLRGYSKEAPVSLPADFIGFKKRCLLKKFRVDTALLIEDNIWNLKRE